ncbi:hypothetical protein KAR91_38435 [Candidatus Pacearchaeota archaeon]|nr:hypothetical protein [Candidatus Pacearchaeota archaeon]
MKKFLKKFFHKKRDRKIKHAILVIIPLMIVAAVIGINEGLKDMTPAVELPVEPELFVEGLMFDEALFAKVSDEGEVTFLEEPIYKRGEAVHFALMNVREFQKGEDGKHWLDMSIEVRNAEGEVELFKEHSLGEGKFELENNTAPSPSGVFVGAPDLQAGTYIMYLTIYDKIGGGKIRQKGVFEFSEESIVRRVGF